MNSMGSWDFQNTHVQGRLSGQQFLGAQSTLIAAGPPTLRQAGHGIGEVLAQLPAPKKLPAGAPVVSSPATVGCAWSLDLF